MRMHMNMIMGFVTFPQQIRVAPRGVNMLPKDHLVPEAIHSTDRRGCTEYHPFTLERSSDLLKKSPDSSTQGYMSHRITKLGSRSEIIKMASHGIASSSSLASGTSRSKRNISEVDGSSTVKPSESRISYPPAFRVSSIY